MAAVVVVAVVLGVVLGRGGSSSGIPTGTPTVGQLDVNSLPGSAQAAALFKGIPQSGLTLGSPTAPVQMLMFIDLQCPRCQEYELTALPTIVKKYVRTGKVQILLKPWAFIGPDSVRGQDATLAASLQNKAFNFADVLYLNQGVENTGWLTDRMLAQIAASVPGLHVPQLFAQRSSSSVNQLQKDVDAEATADKVDGTPTILVGKRGTQPQDVAHNSGLVPTLQQTVTAISAALGQ